MLSFKMFGFKDHLPFWISNNRPLWGGGGGEPALHVWVFIAQLVEHCSAYTEAMGSIPVEVPASFCFPG